MADRTQSGPPMSARAAAIPGEAHLTQSAEPPRWMVDAPGEDGLDNPVDMAGAEAFPARPDVWDDQSG